MSNKPHTHRGIWIWLAVLTAFWLLEDNFTMIRIAKVERACAEQQVNP